MPYRYNLLRLASVKSAFLYLFGTRIRVFGACVLSAALLASCSNRTELPQSVKNLSLKTLKGNEISLLNLQSPMLINFWSTSCVICIQEMPEVAELYEQYAPKGFELVAVAMPYDAPNEVLQLAQALELPFPVALDLKGEAVDAFGSVQGTPTSFLLDTDGRLVERYVGAINLNELRSQLDKLLDNS